MYDVPARGSGIDERRGTRVDEPVGQLHRCRDSFAAIDPIALDRLVGVEPPREPHPLVATMASNSRISTARVWTTMERSLE